MFKDHPHIDTPSDDVVLWRYLSVDRLLALINGSELALCRMDRFDDPWEGAWPQVFRNALPNQGDMGAPVDIVRELSKTFYVNCWHESPHESAALWSQYSGQAGFAVRTTVGALKSAIGDHLEYRLGRVEYLDYRDPRIAKPLNALSPAFMKRRSFEHEREVRLLHWKTDGLEVPRESLPGFVQMPVSLKRLIKEVVISPMAPKWFDGHVAGLMSAYNLDDLSVTRSPLYDPYPE